MNFKYSTLLLAAAAITIINFQSCSKYDDNSGLHLRTKKGRLTGEWEVVKINGQNPNEYYSSSGSSYSSWSTVASGVEVIFEFEKDGDFKYKRSGTRTNTHSGNYGGIPYTYTSDMNNSWKGEWEWEDNKEEIEIEYDGDLYDYEITKLTNKEMTLEDSYGNEWEFEKD